MYSYFTYLKVTSFEGETADLFTAVCLPDREGQFPVVIYRSPYVDALEATDEETIVRQYESSHSGMLTNGFAVVVQHCRGRGKSSGSCVPYIYEREDGLALHEWIRKQPFYNGELYLCGGSYLSSVHYVCAPFAPDIRGAVLSIQDCERYNCVYRNGFFKIGLHGGWYAGMYKKKQLKNKCYVPEAFHTLPLSAFSKAVFGESAPDLDETFKHPDRSDPFWKTRYGGGETRDAVRHARIPILFTTGFYDIYTGGIFDMWNGLDEETKRQCALVVHPYPHSGKPDGQPVAFENATLSEAFGDYNVKWLKAVRGTGAFPFEQGKVTYYPSFGNGWRCDDFKPTDQYKTFTLGEGERTYRYNPYAPASFRGGLSANFEGTAWQTEPGKRYDVLTFYTPVFAQDTFVKGRMTASLTVRSSCEDTCFYMRISLCKHEGDYGLRDDINQISNFVPDYVPGDKAVMTFTFDEHAFTVKAGERLRIDVSSSAFPHYVRHTNNRGLFSEQTTARVADNTVVCAESTLSVPIETTEE